MYVFVIYNVLPIRNLFMQTQKKLLVLMRTLIALTAGYHFITFSHRFIIILTTDDKEFNWVKGKGKGNVFI